MCQRRYNYFPLVFQWHGSLFRVRSVERCWSQAVGLPLRGGARRLWFRVRAAADAPPGSVRQEESRVEVYQDLTANTWHMGSVQALAKIGGPTFAAA
jgi:hypothetical protein